MANVVSITLRAIDQTKAGFTTPIKNLQDLEKVAGKIAPAFLAIASTAAAAFTAMSIHAINTADEMGKFAQKTGLTTEAFSSLNYAAGLMGVETEVLAKGIKKLSENIAEAQVAGSEANLMFARLGISLKDQNGNLLTTDQILLRVAEAFSTHADGVNKTTAAVKLFGERLGTELIPLLNKGAEGIREAQEEATLLGQVFSGPAGKSAEEFSEDWKKLKASIQGVVNQVVVEFLPSVAELFSAFIKWEKESGVLEGAVNSLIDVLRVLRYSIELVMNAAEAIWDVFKGIAEGIADLLAALKTEIEAFGKALGSMFAALEEMFKGHWSNAKFMANDALDTLRTDFSVWKNQIISIGTDTASGFLKAFALLAKGPILPEFAQGPTPEMLGPPTASSLAKKPDMPSAISSISKQEQEAYNLEQEMILKTEEAWISASDTKISLGEKQAAQLQVDLESEEFAYGKRIEQINNLQVTEIESYALIETAAQEHAQKLQKIHTASAKAVQQSYFTIGNAVANTLGSLASLAQTFGRKGFLAYQALSIGQAIISTATGAARAFADFPWPVSGFVAAAVSAAGLAQVAAIVAQKPPQAHAGASFIPEESTYLLQRGERVLAPEQNQDLTQFLSAGGGGRMSEINFSFDGNVFGRAITKLANAGRIEIPVRAIV